MLHFRYFVLVVFQPLYTRKDDVDLLVHELLENHGYSKEVLVYRVGDSFLGVLVDLFYRFVVQIGQKFLVSNPRQIIDNREDYVVEDYGEHEHAKDLENNAPLIPRLAQDAVAGEPQPLAPRFVPITHFR